MLHGALILCLATTAYGQNIPPKCKYQPAKNLRTRIEGSSRPVDTEEMLRAAIQDYLLHCHTERNHQGLEKRTIDPGDEVGQAEGEIQCRERLGGLLRTTTARPHSDQGRTTTTMLAPSVRADCRFTRPASRIPAFDIYEREDLVSQKWFPYQTACLACSTRANRLGSLSVEL